MLGIALGKSIPCEANIFVDDDTKVPLAINQTVALVLKILEAQDAKEAEEAVAGCPTPPLTRLRHFRRAFRSDKRSVGNEWVSTCRARWSRYHSKKNTKNTSKSTAI